MWFIRLQRFLQICTVLMKNVPDRSSETCNWAMNVKVEEDDPLAILFPTVKAEPGVSLCQTHFTYMCITVFAFWTLSVFTWNNSFQVNYLCLFQIFGRWVDFFFCILPAMFLMTVLRNMNQNSEKTERCFIKVLKPQKPSTVCLCILSSEVFFDTAFCREIQCISRIRVWRLLFTVYLM
jgi:hypothetical protein